MKDARELLGKKVIVTLSKEGSEDGLVVTKGRLLGFGDGGDFEIDEGDGFIHYCWPMLDIKADRGDEELEALVERWHQGEGGGMQLHKFLGMTWEEYGQWAGNR